jgi:hypothetical protein
MYRISSRGQPDSGSPLAWGSGEGLITPRRRKAACYEMLHTATELEGYFGTTKVMGNRCHNWKREC